MEIKFDGKGININQAIYFEKILPIQPSLPTAYVMPNILLEVKNNTEEAKYIQKCIFEKNVYLIEIDNNATEYFLPTKYMRSLHLQLKQNNEKLWFLFVAADIKEVLKNGD